MIVVGLSHHSAPIGIREKLAVNGDSLHHALDRMTARDGIAEIVMLSTCNRVEVYAAAPMSEPSADPTREVVAVLAEMGGREVVPHLMSANGSSAVKHLFRVASSLDSLVLGEPQILGQLKDAIRTAQARKLVGPRLAPAMRHAMQVAKRVRTETEIGNGQVSVPSVAVDLARRIFDDLAGQVALLVGAGDMAESAARLLARHGTRSLVVNRSPEKAEQLAALVGGEPRRWESLEDSLAQADIVIASTASPRPVITKSMVKSILKKRRGRSLFVIDIAVPRDVEPAVNELENVYLYDIDDLSKVVAMTLEGRAAEAQRAETIVAEEARNFLLRRSQEAVTPIIVGMRERLAQTLKGELDKSLKGRLKHLAATDREALEAMMGAAVNKLLHQPSTRLKAMALEQRSDDAAQVLTELFDLEEVQAQPRAEPEIVTEEMDEDTMDADERRAAAR